MRKHTEQQFLHSSEELPKNEAFAAPKSDCSTHIETTAPLLKMSVRRLSPTADLLRNSRLFALPHPLPRTSRPSIAPALGGGTSNFDSDTATLPYPTHAAIETTEESLARGDWGLKRSLPLRSTTRTSTPSIKIENIDSIDHITDFSSSADHVLTLQKWQEIDMPMSVMLRERRASTYQPPPKSVFESELDNTAIHADSVQERWKFKGPWLAGQNEFEFSDFLRRKVKKRKGAFREFLRQRLVRSQPATSRREMLEKGEQTEEALENVGQEPVTVTDKDLDYFVKRLRKDQDAMQRLLEEFLDLPREQSAQRAAMGRPTYNDKGPPTTHPSAGLSYLRTAAHTFNHPIHGPQENKTPYLARVLKPQGSLGPSGRSGGRKQAVVGVAGVAAEDSRKPFARGDDLPEVELLNPDMPGGGKVWVQPKRADIDVQGRIQLGTKRAEKNAVHVLMDDRGELKKEDLPAAAVDSATNREVPDLAPPRQEPALGSIGYGLGDVAMPRSPRAKPFEEEGDVVGLLGRAWQGKKSPKS